MSPEANQVLSIWNELRAMLRRGGDTDPLSQSYTDLYKILSAEQRAELHDAQMSVRP